MEGYKVSRYTTVHKTRYGLILFNTLSCGLLKITDDNVEVPSAEIVPLLAARGPAHAKALVEHGFLVKNYVNELALVKSRLYRSRYGMATATITINTGLACNCHCVYCYEGHEHSASSVLTHEKASDIVDFLKKEFSPTTKLDLTFVGGEPLICLEHIKRIHSELKGFFDHMSLSISTNGILINEDVAMFLKEAQVKSVQISIDGVKSYHDKKRAYVAGGGTYDKVIASVKVLQEADIPVLVRTHVDQDFMDNVNLQQWIEAIKTTFDFTKPIWFYITPIQTPGNGVKIADGKFVDHMVSIYEAFMEKEIPLNFDHSFMPSGLCFVAYENSFSITCNGEIYKCWNDLTADNFNDRNFGNIYDGINREKVIAYTDSIDALESAECRACVYLPVCSGGCPEYIVSGSSKCTHLKHYSEKIIPLFMQYKGHLSETTKSKHMGDQCE